jgi:hypothetical protein
VTGDGMYDWNDRFKRSRPEPALQPVNGHVNGHTTAYGAKALAGEVETMQATGEGSRNHQLNTSAFKLGGLVGGGELAEADAAEQLKSAAMSVGLDSTEVFKTFRSGIEAGKKSPRQAPPRPLMTTVIDPASLVAPSEAVEGFWERRDILTHIRDFARARMCSPWSLLGVCLLRALAVIPPHVVLPPLIGGYGSLNMFVALVGASGVGKGATEAAAIDAIDFCTDIYTAPIGSGEGIAHQYAHRERDGIARDRDSVLFSVSEIDTLTALGNRQGSTLLSQLRSAFSGERLGFGYADATRRLPIERHTYRFGLTVGVQPEKARPLLDDVDGGTPQRFLWLPATDPEMTPDGPEAPPQWVIEEQHWIPGRDRFTVLPVPPSVAACIRNAHAARGRGEGEALDGHALFVREKVAQALTILDQRRTMTEDDWELSGTVMIMSDVTRTRVGETVHRQLTEADTARAHREASKAVVIAETVAEAAAKRVAAKVFRIICEEQDITIGILRRKVSSRDRDYIDEAVDRLVRAGQVQVEEAGSSRHLVPQKCWPVGHWPTPPAEKTETKNRDEKP